MKANRTTWFFAVAMSEARRHIVELKKLAPRLFGVATLLAAVALLPGLVSRAAGDEAKVKQVAAEKLPNVPGKTITAVVVNYAPGGKSGKHHHAGSVLAYVLSGAIRSENSATGPSKVYQAGESFFEPPGTSISSAKTPARPSRRACSLSLLPMMARS